MKFLSASSAREDDALLDNAADNIKISIRVLREGGRPDIRRSHRRRSYAISIRVLREGGRHIFFSRCLPAFYISIRVLREGGRPVWGRNSYHARENFYPRPPRGRTTDHLRHGERLQDISIRVLREGGRPPAGSAGSLRRYISIRVLREGGRRRPGRDQLAGHTFLSASSAREDDKNGHFVIQYYA